MRVEHCCVGSEAGVVSTDEARRLLGHWKTRELKVALRRHLRKLMSGYWKTMP